MEMEMEKTCELNDNPAIYYRVVQKKVAPTRAGTADDADTTSAGRAAGAAVTVGPPTGIILPFIRTTDILG